MPSKRLVHFYDNHCNSTVLKIASYDRELKNIRMIISMRMEQSESLWHQISSVWDDSLGKPLQHRDIFFLKRKEALIQSRREVLQLEIAELKVSLDDITLQRDDLIKLRFYYEKKKKKWEWMFCNEKKARVRKDINRDERAIEECVTWVK